MKSKSNAATVNGGGRDGAAAPGADALPVGAAKFHIIGDRDTILGYQFAGVTGTAVATPAEAQTAFRAATADGSTQVLILTEVVARMLEAEVTQHRLAARPPYLVEVADIWGTKVARRTLEQSIQEAIGVRIVKETT